MAATRTAQSVSARQQDADNFSGSCLVVWLLAVWLLMLFYWGKICLVASFVYLASSWRGREVPRPTQVSQPLDVDRTAPAGTRVWL